MQKYIYVYDTSCHIGICIYTYVSMQIYSTHTYVRIIYTYIQEKRYDMYIYIHRYIDRHTYIYTHISAYIAMYLYRQTHLSLDLILCMPSAIYMHVYCRAFIYLYTSNSRTRHGYSSYVAIYLRIRIYIKSIIVTELYTIHIYIYITYLFVIYGGFLSHGGVPQQLDGLCHGKSHSSLKWMITRSTSIIKMDDGGIEKKAGWFIRLL